MKKKINVKKMGKNEMTKLKKALNNNKAVMRILKKYKLRMSRKMTFVL